MKMRDLIEELSNIEKKALKILPRDFLSFKEIAEKTDLNKDSLMRAVAWLNQKELAEIREEKKKIVMLTEEGIDALENGMIEKRFILALKGLKGKASLNELKKKTGLGNEINLALGTAKKNAWVSISKEGNELMLELTGLEEKFLNYKSSEEKLIEKISKKGLETENLSNDEKETLKVLMQRHLAEDKEEIERFIAITKKGLEVKNLAKESKGEINFLTKNMIVTGSWKGKKFRKYNLQEPVPPMFIGKKSPYIQFLNQIRRKLTELGFKEMKTPTIVSEFYNFDVLFQPQNHPARTWTDTYSLKKPSHGKLPKEKVKAVKAAHEYGGVSASSGWQYSWSEIIASKLMPSAHATAHSARQITEGIEVPGKYYAIARCYRPDVLDATHLVEFNQMEGFIAGKDLNFRHLLGMLKQFAIEVAGAEKVRFYPDYYPFTEPSVQLSAKHPQLGWIEFAGAGMFRPEMMENLGIKEPTLAWGMGIDRLAMFKMGIEDIRYLFSDDLNWLREAKQLEIEE